MREAVFFEYGDPSVIRIIQRDLPPPRPDEVTLRVLACGLNHLDLDLRRGVSRFDLNFPHRLGREIVGIVEAAGSEANHVAAGTRVLVLPIIPCGKCNDCEFNRDNLCSAAVMPGINIPGGYGEYVNVPSRGIIPLLPDQDPYLVAAAPIAYGTAWRMLVTLASVVPGETVLVNGASGGLGTALIHVAVLRGASVIGTVGFDEKRDYVLEQGASMAINYVTSDLAKDVLEFTQGQGVDVAVDCIGGDILGKTLTCVAPRGRVIVGGGHGGEIVPIDVIAFFRNELQLMGSRSQTRSELEQVMTLLRQGKIRPHINQTFRLDEVVSAHQLLESRQFTGKNILCL